MINKTMTTENYEQKKHGLGHMAIFTILLWGTTFYFYKTLLGILLRWNFDHPVL